MIVDIDNLITLTTYAKTLGVSRQRINQIKNTLPIVIIDGQPFIDKSKLDIIDSGNISVPIVDATINQGTGDDMLDY